MIAAAWTAACVVLMFGYGPAFCWVARRRVRRQEVARRARLASEWSRLTALQAKAREEIDAEAGHFQLWEQEVSA
ncbi:MAG TPA: hypothetical protein VJ782_08715 [Aeromicrobium sp.]|nr:hypothetical protein [Aeromicrobium sp.]